MRLLFTLFLSVCLASAFSQINLLPEFKSGKSLTYKSISFDADSNYLSDQLVQLTSMDVYPDSSIWEYSVKELNYKDEVSAEMAAGIDKLFKESPIILVVNKRGKIVDIRNWRLIQEKFMELTESMTRQYYQENEQELTQGEIDYYVEATMQQYRQFSGTKKSALVSYAPILQPYFFPFCGTYPSYGAHQKKDQYRILIGNRAIPSKVDIALQKPSKGIMKIAMQEKIPTKNIIPETLQLMKDNGYGEGLPASAEEVGPDLKPELEATAESLGLCKQVKAVFHFDTKKKLPTKMRYTNIDQSEGSETIGYAVIILQD